MVKVPTIDELLQRVRNNKKATAEDFENAITSVSYWQRFLTLGDITADVGDAMEGMIRFWNLYDDEQNIPVEDRQPIVIFIDSAGGDLNATFTMIDAIKMSKTPVWTVNIGSACSGGFFTFITGHKRFAYKNCVFLYHEGSADWGGDANKFQNFSEFYKGRLASLKNLVLTNTKVSEALYEEKRRDDWWISAQEALDLGITDKIVDSFNIKD